MSKWISVAFMVIMCGSIAYLAACSGQQIAASAEVVQEAAKAAAPMLPPPFGIIASLVAGAAGVVATLAAGKSKGASLAAGNDPHPVADFISSHSWVFPSVTAAVGLANSMGWLHISPTELGTLASALGVATVTQIASDNHAEAKAPSA